MTQALSIALFGALGALSRFGAQRLAVSFGVASTFSINIAGSFLIGLVAVAIERGGLSQVWAVGIVAGFLGGFTTFSTYSLEALGLLSKKQYGLFALYFVGSPAVGLVSAWLGVQLGRGLWKIPA